MANYDDRLKDYVQVNERIIAFYEEYPRWLLAVRDCRVHQRSIWAVEIKTGTNQ